MIVRTLEKAERTQRRVEDPNGNWDSVRLLLKDDNMGFSFHITTIYAGADFQMHYQNHQAKVKLKPWMMAKKIARTVTKNIRSKQAPFIYSTNMINTSCALLKK